MEWLNNNSGILSMIAIIISIIAIIVSIVLSKQSSKQTKEYHKDWDRKRKYYNSYDAYAEFQDNVRRK